MEIPTRIPGSSPPAGGSGLRPASWVLQGLLPFLLVLVVSFALIGRALDQRVELRLLPGSVEADKHALFREHGDEYDLVFVGTSRVLRGFDPAAFERRSAELGMHLSAFNFGLVGLGFLEQIRLVDWILDQEPERLRFLVLEPTERDVIWHVARKKSGKRGRASSPEQGNLFTLRDVNWHTPELTVEELDSIWSGSRDAESKLEESWLHVLHALHRGANLGTGTNLLMRAIEENRPAAIDDSGFGGKDERAPWGEQPEERVAVQDAEPTSPVLWDLLRRTLGRARAQGIRVILVVPPTADPLDVLAEAQASGHLEPVLTYTPQTWPELFQDRKANFFDPRHLNRNGARLFSERLADDLFPQLLAEH